MSNPIESDLQASRPADSNTFAPAAPAAADSAPTGAGGDAQSAPASPSPAAATADPYCIICGCTNGNACIVRDLSAPNVKTVCHWLLVFQGEVGVCSACAESPQEALELLSRHISLKAPQPAAIVLSHQDEADQLLRILDDFTVTVKEQEDPDEVNLHICGIAAIAHLMYARLELEQQAAQMANVDPVSPEHYPRLGKVLETLDGVLASEAVPAFQARELEHARDEIALIVDDVAGVL